MEKNTWTHIADALPAWMSCSDGGKAADALRLAATAEANSYCSEKVRSAGLDTEKSPGCLSCICMVVSREGVISEAPCVWDALSVELMAREKAEVSGGGNRDSRAAQLVAGAADRNDFKRLVVVTVVVVPSRTSTIDTGALGRMQQQTLFDSRLDLPVGASSASQNSPLTHTSKAAGSVVMAFRNVSTTMDTSAGHLGHPQIKKLRPDGLPVSRAQVLPCDNPLAFTLNGDTQCRCQSGVAV